jgi:hypothetical protein
MVDHFSYVPGAYCGLVSAILTEGSFIVLVRIVRAVSITLCGPAV